MNIWLPVSLGFALLLQPASPTDSRPQFSGTWVLDLTRSDSAVSSNLPDPVLVEIAQSDRDLTIVTTQGSQQHRVVHGFVATPTAPYSIDGAASRAYWNGSKLITEGTRVVQGQTVATRETRTLSPDGVEMTVEVVVIVQHGYATRGGRNYGMGRDVYTRVRQ